MKLLKFNIVFAFIFIFLFGVRLSSQSVVVNGYFNEGDPRDEWTELLVITDNTDMRNWSIRDNNGSQNSWQPQINFNNIAFWNNMRAGTVIMIWHRPVTSNGVTLHPTDFNKNDGYIELDASNATYFNGGTLGPSPSWGGTSLNVAGTGEIIELRNSASTHIHGLGHLSPAGADWTAMPTPKLNHANNASSGDAIYVCPGAVIGDYNGPATGNAFTSKNNSTITFGLPNVCGSSALGNTNFWNLLREPIIAAQSYSPTSFVNGNPGSISFAWTGATDPNPADGTIGYIILRNTINSFGTPADGTTYANGSVLGTATVIAHINASGTTNYTDNNVFNGNCYFYRIYAFRYTTDNNNGNSYHQSRGRAYNTTNFVQITCPQGPLPIELISFDAEIKNNTVNLTWLTASELNSSYFDIEKSIDGFNFTSIGKINAQGVSTKITNYNFNDISPITSVTYYRLKEVDNNKHYRYSKINTVNKFNSKVIELNCFPNPTQNLVSVCCFNNNEFMEDYTLVNTLGQKIEIGKISLEGDEQINFSFSRIPTGYYYLTIITNLNVYRHLIIKN